MRPVRNELRLFEVGGFVCGNRGVRKENKLAHPATFQGLLGGTAYPRSGVFTPRDEDSFGLLYIPDREYAAPPSLDVRGVRCCLPSMP
jgi:hypothetical protein